MLTLLLSLRDCFRARAFLQAEILALRHQLLVLQRSNRGHKLRLGWADRVLWVWLSRLCLAVVERLAIGVAPCQTGDGYRLASQGISPLLEMEESVWRRSPDGISGSSESHPAHESRQPSLGRSSHSWGTPETRYSGVAGNSRQVHGPAPETSLPVVANLSQESRQGLGFCRFLHCPNDCVPTPIRLCDSRSGPQTSDSFRGDR